MATTTVTPDHDTITSEIEIAAPPERVFRALTDAAEVRRQNPNLDVYEMDVRVGGLWRMEMRMSPPYHGVSVIHHGGEILEIDPPRLLVYTWTANFHSNPNHRSIVRWELTPTKSGTHLKVMHSGLAAEPAASKDYAGGWPGVLTKIKNDIESK
ncbi:MAG TPA: SRPBCC domain-containing protein [Verrucomicrobiae bacterium]|jgi:uncharacterized protein YndB with AHSA1/START domain|nr:SRPBCC domain-containing protein [Verrucomicrobiae bacterium]